MQLLAERAHRVGEGRIVREGRQLSQLRRGGAGVEAGRAAEIGQHGDDEIMPARLGQRPDIIDQIADRRLHLLADDALNLRGRQGRLRLDGRQHGEIIVGAAPDDIEAALADGRAAGQIGGDLALDAGIDGNRSQRRHRVEAAQQRRQIDAIDRRGPQGLVELSGEGAAHGEIGGRRGEAEARAQHVRIDRAVAEAEIIVGRQRHPRRAGGNRRQDGSRDDFRDIAGVRQAVAENDQIRELLGGGRVTGQAEAQGGAGQELLHRCFLIIIRF